MLLKGQMNQNLDIFFIWVQCILISSKIKIIFQSIKQIRHSIAEILEWY